ncbi:hypothetical protein mRhiFer1_009462 [Rhinolophus ferrumequinum]|uniref:Uncharacterized protein n=1 Tax=Rhinolophus ferrumequinum TaxID=59479 RepID=A0A7J7RJ02_RHIFE|nr:hypothetical protein mRhiFer1_009462 [Rhinolophus ferrumequinum]
MGPALGGVPSWGCRTVERERLSLAPGLQARRPQQWQGRLGLCENNASSPSGLRLRKPVLRLGNQVLGTAKPLPAQGRWEARVEGAPPRQTKPGLEALIARNELFAVPGVGEDEPVIIFKFAIIDLGKSYCDKNELIIKFISEINSAAIKQLAGAAGAACCPAFLAAKSPRQAPAGSAGGRGVGHNNYTFSRAPVPRGAEGAGCSPAGWRERTFAGA